VGTWSESYNEVTVDEEARAGREVHEDGNEKTRRWAGFRCIGDPFRIAGVREATVAVGCAS
jgi:hypothetical protein